MKRKRENPLYFDVNATTPLAPSVLDAIQSNLRDAWGNPSSSHVYGKRARDVINQSRVAVARMIGLDKEGDEGQVLFMSGGTEANNMVFHSIVEDAKGCEPPHVIISSIEHDSIVLPAKHLEKEGKITLTIIPPNAYGFVDPLELQRRLTPKTKLVSIMMANNETGIIQPIEEIRDTIRKYEQEHNLRIYFHTDAAQVIGKIPVNASKLGVDYLTIVGHKFYAPRIGSLFVKNLGKPEGAPLHPQLFGGGQEGKFRRTENTGMIAGLGEAARLITSSLETYFENMRKARDHFQEMLIKEFGEDNVHFNGNHPGKNQRIPNTCNFSLIGEGLEGWRILSKVELFVASLGAACHSDQGHRASPILLASGVKESVAKNAIRFSVGRDTTLNDVEDAIKEIARVVSELKSTK